MLQATPFHRENYSRLIVGIIAQYYQHCSSRYRGKEIAMYHELIPSLELVSKGLEETSQEEKLALPATRAQREDVIQVLQRMRADKVSKLPLSTLTSL